MTPRPGTVPGGSEVDPVEFASRFVDQMANKDLKYTTLYNCLLGSEESNPISGFLDHDYPPVFERGLMPKDVFTTVHTAPIPSELQELLNQPDVDSVQMGLFPEIYRAWMTIDSDLYLWDFRDGSDLSFYDGLKESIITMALVPVRPRVFRPSIQHLLCVSTISSIVVLGFITTQGSSSENPVLELVSQPIFVISTDEVRFPVIAGADTGRIFLGALDGTLHEIAYQSERGWISDRCWKTNLTRSIFSSILPKFLTSSNPDSIAQIVADNARKLLFTRSSSGAVVAYDLGHDGQTFRSVGSLSFDTIVSNVMKISRNTLEPNFVRKIISIGVIEYGELNLVAVTDSGCRIYFSCYSPPQSVNRGPNVRPQVFNLVHVRMPPGYCPTSGTRKPPFGHSAYISHGVYTFVTKASQDQDATWFIVPLMYPSQHCAEVCSVHMLPGYVRDITAIPLQTTNGLDLNKSQLPDVVTQHLAWSRQIVVLTPNGTVVFRQSKPFELLRDLLIERKGPENIKGHFELCASREQPLANVVLLASHPYNHLEPGIYDLATKAFFMYGSISESNQQSRPNISPAGAGTFDAHHATFPGGMHDSTIVFNPNVVSTPNRDRERFASFQDAFGASSPQSPIPGTSFSSPLGQQFNVTGVPNQQSFYPGAQQPQYASQFQQTGVPQQFHPGAYQPSPQQDMYSPYTPRHDALYLVVARILLPFWHQQLIKVSNPEGPNAVKLITPNINGDEVGYAITFLGSVLTFINNNPSLYISRVNVTPTSMNTPDARRALNQEQEKNSIAALRNFLSLTLEVLGMWKLLCEHQFHIVLHGVDDRLHNSTMKELVVNGYSTVAIIINALVSKYLGDNAAVDAISIRLREVCPTLFKNEDAIGSKVAEILAKVKIISDRRDREGMLQEALHLCEEICGHGRINIRNFCKQFAELGFPQGAVRLCLSSAQASDPNQLALMTLRNSNDSTALQAYQKRLEIYKIVLDILDGFISTAATRQSPLLKQAQPPSDDQLSPEKAKEYADVMIRAVLSSEDEPFHIALYNWLMDRKLFDRLLEIKHPYLDSFLQRAADSVVSGQWPSDVPNPNDTRVLDLLWRHHEMNHNYLAAAQILSKLSESTTTNLNLYQRMEYLSRAIICCKSCNSQGELLEQLEAKLEVARIQKMILEWVNMKLQSQVGGTVGAGGEDGSHVIEAKTLQDLAGRLNAQLYNITTLYGDYATPLKLHDIRLEIFYSAGHAEKQLIESLWADIVEAELQASERHSLESQMEIIRRKLVSMGRKFKNAPAFFPVEYLVEHLETMKPAENADPGWVFKTMLDVGIPYTELLLVYERLWRKLISRQAAGTASVDIQIANVIVMMIGVFVNDSINFQLNFMQRAELIEKCKDLVAQMIVEFSSRFEASAKEIAQKLTLIKDRLDRLQR
ncbi:unnamed protein product [Allacma fusca]|uniref:Nuclear pore complex protein Nup155 n=1 Tax=Allacma fusca TaxID=39272 RepID=A0A8J2P9C8_9HEXA|nr:unnamed protein product [Allacma fusca]